MNCKSNSPVAREQGVLVHAAGLVEVLPPLDLHKLHGGTGGGGRLRGRSDKVRGEQGLRQARHEYPVAEGFNTGG